MRRAVEISITASRTEQTLEHRTNALPTMCRFAHDTTAIAKRLEATIKRESTGTIRRVIF
jgi:hypothetical protein